MLKLYENIKRKRLELGYSQTKLAELTGYADKSMIAKIEKGRVDISQSKLKLFAEALHTTPSEAYAIQIGDIDFDKETVHIKGTKTRLSDRVVPLPSVISTLLKKSLTGEIRASKFGQNVTKEVQRGNWRKFSKECNRYLNGAFGTDLTAYNLRHEFCTELARRGVDIRITQRLMGHASPEMTLRVYTNLSDEDVCTDKIREIVNDLQSCKR